jgi:hypothetical protein
MQLGQHNRTGDERTDGSNLIPDPPQEDMVENSRRISITHLIFTRVECYTRTVAFGAVYVHWYTTKLPEFQEKGSSNTVTQDTGLLKDIPRVFISEEMFFEKTV